MIFVQTGALLVLLLLSAFFSGTETAFFSLNSLERDSFRKGSPGSVRAFVQLLFSNPDNVLITILTGNMLVNVFATTLSDIIGARVVGEGSEIYSILVMTPLLLIVGEMTPKNIAIRHSLSFARFSTPFIEVVDRFLRPLTFVLGKIQRFFLYRLHDEEEDAGVKNTSVLSAIRMGYENGKIQEAELNLLESFFDFRHKVAKDVMIPRIETFGVDISSPLHELIGKPNVIKKSQQPYVVVYKGDIDNIVGYINRKELLTSMLSGENDRDNYPELIKPAHMVPEKKKIMDLLTEMREIDSELVVVIDEYGGTAGILNYQIIVEYLFEDFFPASERSIIPIDNDKYIVPGSLEIDSVNEFFDTDIQSDTQTLGGFILDHIGTFPENGYVFTHKNFELTVLNIEKNRIKKIQVRRLNK